MQKLPYVGLFSQRKPGNAPGNEQRTAASPPRARHPGMRRSHKTTRSSRHRRSSPVDVGFDQPVASTNVAGSGGQLTRHDARRTTRPTWARAFGTCTLAGGMWADPVIANSPTRAHRPPGTKAPYSAEPVFCSCSPATCPNTSEALCPPNPRLLVSV